MNMIDLQYSVPASSVAAVVASNEAADRVEPTVLTWLQSGRHTAPDSELFLRAHRLGWLDSAFEHVIVQAVDDSPMVVDTVRALAAFFGAFGSRVELVGEAAVTPASASPAIRDIAREERLSLVGLGNPARLVVPKLWFEDHYLVTVAGLACDGRSQFKGILDTQSAPLGRLGNPHPDVQLASEAHRLAPSDLCIICGYEGKDRRPLWWAVSRSDVGLDGFVCSLAGMERAALPALREVARHELLPSDARTVGPTLPECSTARLRPNALRAALGRIRTAASAGAMEWKAIRRNLHRIPHAVRRRLARSNRS